MRSPKSSDMWTVTLVINFAMIINHMGDLLCKAALDMETYLTTLFRMKNLEPCELRIYRIKIYIFSVSVTFTSLRGHGFILRQSLEDVDPEIVMHI